MGAKNKKKQGTAAAAATAQVDDPKLLHLVRKLLNSANTNNSNVVDASSPRPAAAAAADVVSRLRSKHREYQRKDLERLTIQVEKAIEQINNSSSGSSSTPQQSSSRKRQAEALEEANHEQHAVANDKLREQVGAGGGLNASLRNRYRQVQLDRANSGMVETTTETGTDNNNNNNNNNNKTTPKKTPQPSSLSRQSSVASETSRSKTETTTTTPNGADAPDENMTSSTTKLKRRKVKTKGRVPSGLGGGAGEMNMIGNNSDLSYLSPVPRPVERYADLGGMTAVISQLRQLVEYPVLRPELYRHLGVDPPRGVLLRGPPGTGKTHLANAVAGELGGAAGAAYFRVSAPELVSGMSGESEGRIRSLFQAASAAAPAIIFLDELDAIAPKRANDAGSRGMEKRMVAQLLTCLDMVAPANNRNQAAVVVLGATNRPDALDAALRRAGRFDAEILLGVPDQDARECILQNMTARMRLAGDFDYRQLARLTPGYVGADVKSLAKQAAVLAMNRIFSNVLLNQNNSTPAATTTTAAATTRVVAADAGSTAAAAAAATGTAGSGDNDNKMDDDNNDDAAPRAASHDGQQQQQQQQQHAAAPTATATAVTSHASTTNGNSNSSNHNNTTTAVIAPLTPEQMAPLYVCMEDFLAALPLVQPSSLREGFATVPDISWDDIGALDSIRAELTISVLEPIRSPEKFKALGLSPQAGVLLYGPPGCGKTLLAKAIAHESGFNFISVKGPELLDKYVGESERAVRQVFERARASSPCIVFFDELDSLVPKRGSDAGGGGVSERVVNQLLTEMDGLESRRSVFVIAATNRPELIDPAMLRPGRLDKLLYVPLPTPQDRASILQALAKNVQIAANVDLMEIGKSPRADGYSGADCAALLREAGLAVLKEDAAAASHVAAAPAGSSSDSNKTTSSAVTDLQICNRHFDQAFLSVLPSVSKKDQARYDRIRSRISRARSRGPPPPPPSTAGEEEEDGVDAATEAAAAASAAPVVSNGGDAAPPPPPENAEPSNQ